MFGKDDASRFLIQIGLRVRAADKITTFLPQRPKPMRCGSHLQNECLQVCLLAPKP